MMATHTHIPVALDRCMELMAPALQEGGLVVDATVGLGGHAAEILARFPGVRLLGIDRDPAAIALSSQRLAEFGSRVRLVQARYDELGEILDRELDGEAPRAILLDLGVSSMQLDDAARGFSYLADAQLDMRMNPADEEGAFELVNQLSAFELQRVFERFGDEPLAARYARAIVQARQDGPINTTGQLVSIIDRATPAAAAKRGHNAKRVFQALRIAVNRELEILERTLDVALDRLAQGGRIVVLSYHSGEDRLVKRAIEARTQTTAPPDLPVVPEADLPTYRWLVKAPEGPAAEEEASNPRSRSVRLRAAEKLRGTLR